MSSTIPGRLLVGLLSAVLLTGAVQGAFGPSVAAAGTFATVLGTDNDGARCRADAGWDAETVDVITEGEVIELAGDLAGAWQPIYCAGGVGYVHVDFVSYDDGAGTSGWSAVTGYALIVATDGDGARCRDSASYEGGVVSLVAEGAEIALRDGSSGEWQAVVCDGMNGYIHAEYIGWGQEAASSGGARLAYGDHAMVNSALNLRDGAGFNSGVAAVAEAGTVVMIIGEPVNGFYPVDWSGLTGYMYNDYLSWTDAGLTDRGSASTAWVGSSSGSALVGFALQYVGYPYVWAGDSPAGFDCSGFTLYVARNVLGLEITHDMFTQFAMGSQIDIDSLAPGDLVFFQNTYTWGLSHVGIYIGGGQFVHAENPSTGVVISDLYSDYYISRWYGAVRLA